MPDDWRALRTAREHTTLLLGAQPAPVSSVGAPEGIVYIGPLARLVPITGGFRIEVKNSSGVWVSEQEWTEA